MESIFNEYKKLFMIIKRKRDLRNFFKRKYFIYLIIVLLVFYIAKFITFDQLTIKKQINIMIEHDIIINKNFITKEEALEGWKLLFNGKTLDGWREFNKHNLDNISGWDVINGNLVRVGRGTDIITINQYDNFELYLEWLITEGSNSGILYHVSERHGKKTYETSPEYQIIDDKNYPLELENWQLSGACYGLCPVTKSQVYPIGQYNSTRIVVYNDHVEHWLNGKKVVEYKLWSDDWKKKVNKTMRKNPSFGTNQKGHIALQSYGKSIVCFRNIKLKIIEGGDHNGK